MSGRVKEWKDLILVSALEDKWVTRVRMGSRLIAVYDTPSGIYASMALCSHGGADLCDGYFDKHIIECPLHQGAFDVRDGKAVSAPATRPMRTIETRIADNMLQILI
jgi:naphthalene 1,2-dioxygenase system ferredoxin subunit